MMRPSELQREQMRREMMRRGYRRLALLVFFVCVIVGGGVFCVTQAASLNFSNIFGGSAAAADAVQPPSIGNASTTPVAPNAYANISIIGKAAIVYDLTNGKVLYAQNAYAPMPLASITKLLTLYAAANVLTPTSTVTMTPLALAQDGDTADTGFAAGETFNFEDLARLTLAASSNAGAEAIAESADTAANTTTTQLLANAASTAGLTQIQANNSTGLDQSTTVSGSYASAHDVAVLAGKLLVKAPDIAGATTLPSVSITSLQGKQHSFANTDIDVTHFPNLLLSKTGYTDLAGGNLVIVYDAGIDHPVAIVVLGSTENGRFTDMQQLMAATLAHFGGVTPPAHK
jgi:D-alanyl-D-alanine carboxypeptidase (penicillin-binding protein 5/6)